MPSSSIAAANKEVKQILDKANKPEENLAKCGAYEHFTPEEKAQIGKRAAEYGVTASLRYYSRAFPGRSLKESTVKVWKMKYLQEIVARRRAGGDMTVKELANKRLGCPLMLGEDLDKQVHAYLTAL